MSEVPITEIADVNPPLPRHVRDDEMVSFVKMADLKEDGGLIPVTDVPFGSVKLGFTRFAEGDVLFAKITPCMENGKGALATSLTNSIGCGSTEFHVLRAKGDANASFIYQVLQSKAVRQKAEMNMSGSAGQQRVPSSFFSQCKIFAPQPPQQRRIAEILSTVDEAIEQTEALIAKYRQIKAGLMQDLFTRGVTPDGHLRPTSAQAPHLYRDSPLGWIPKEWEVSKLRDKSSPLRPHIKTGPFGSSLKGEHWVENGRPVITIGALGEGELLTEGLLFVSEATAHRLREYQLQPGDVVFSRVADVGRSAVICEEHDGWIMSSNLMRISLNQNLIVPGYLQAQFAFDHRVKAQIRAKVNSGGRDVANGQILNQLQFAWPRHEEQHVALKRISALDANRRNVIDQQTKLLKLKHGLMQDLLTGRVRVKVADSVSV
jgi:type I restriction enzyme, S subunit